jgi:DNA-binding NarL/FixJ family response regulator
MKPLERILLVEDCVATRTGLGQYLRMQPVQVTEVGSVEEAWACWGSWQPQVCIVDLILPLAPGQNVQFGVPAGLQFALELRQKQPTGGIILFSAHPTAFKQTEMLIRQRYFGYLYKGGMSFEAIWEVLKTVYLGGVFVAPEIGQVIGENRPGLTQFEAEKINRILEFLPTLTATEHEVARLVTQSLSNAGVAQALRSTTNTIQKHLSNIFDKVELKEINPQFDKRDLLGKAYTIYLQQKK